MASRTLTTCKACNAEISRKAYTCPQCGQPLRKTAGEKIAQGCAGVFMIIVGTVILFTLGGIILATQH